MNDDIQKYRYEIKFVVLPHYYHEIIAWIRSSVYGFCEHYRDRTISNIYFDNNDYDSFFSNVTGLSKRVKVRYRWYDEPHAIKSGNLEVKVKNNKLGYKNYRKLNSNEYLYWFRENNIFTPYKPIRMNLIKFNKYVNNFVQFK